LALGSAMVFWIFALIVVVAVMANFVGMLDVPQEVAGAMYLLAIAMAIAAMILGVTSIVRAARQVGQSGRTAAIVLGGIGIVLSALMGWVLLMPEI
jgi:hypothetical protein